MLAPACRLTLYETRKSSLVLDSGPISWAIRFSPRMNGHWTGISTPTPSTSRFNCDPPTDPTCLAPGTAGRNLVRGPGFVNFDYSLFKDFAFTENRKLQVRFETFNLLNTPHFGNPQGNFGGGADFGRIRRTVENPRILQFAAKLLF